MKKDIECCEDRGFSGTVLTDKTVVIIKRNCFVGKGPKVFDTQRLYFHDVMALNPVCIMNALAGLSICLLG